MRLTRATLLTVLVVALAAGFSQVIAAAEMSALNTTDTNDGACPSPLECSLRDAILLANGTAEEDTINLGAGTYTLTLAGVDNNAQLGDLDITEDLRIQGQGSDLTVVDANHIDRVFHLKGSATTVKLFDLTIRGGRHPEHPQLGAHPGGGILSENASLELVRSVLLDNQTGTNIGMDPYFGGGLSSGTGDVTILNSTIASNWALSGGAGLAIFGGTLLVENSTITANEGGNLGGSALYLAGGHAEVRNSTISGNEAYSSTEPGGIWSQGNLILDSCTITGNVPRALVSAYSGVSTIRNTLIDGSCFRDDTATVISQGGNLESPGDTCRLWGFGDMRNVPDPMLSFSGDHGGHTDTHVPLPGSPAIDVLDADANCRPVDQRGITRPQDGNNDTTATCDIGAVEYVWGEPIPEIFMDGFESGNTTVWSTTAP